MTHPSIERWKTEETIAGVKTIPEGIFVIKRTRVFDHVTLNGWLPEHNRTKQELSESHMLIRRNCLALASVGNTSCARTDSSFDNEDACVIYENVGK
jgi:hypothetical protein